MKNDRKAVWEEFTRDRPWARSFWRPSPGDGMTLFWIVLIHLTAVVGFFLVPLPSLKILLLTLGLTWLGGIGTTVCYHRSLTHRAVKLNPAVRTILTFFTVLNGSGTPARWVANHRLHHANSDTIEDVSSPGIGGFWWAHLRWIWQAGQAPVDKYCPDLNKKSYLIWDRLQLPILIFSYLGGLLFGLEGFFWLGSIRLVFSLHAQCFVNSICHMGKEVSLGNDSSRNVPWLAIWHLFQGENWHRNHHEYPWSAKLGLKPLQIDVGWWVISVLERLRLARDVRRPQAGSMSVVSVPVKS